MKSWKPAFGRTTLKIIAVLTMLCDHLAYVFVDSMRYPELYKGMRIVGRISFPIFCFVLVQGFLSTSNVKKYIARLSVFAILSEVPFDLAFFRTPFTYVMQNVMFTMLIGLLVLVGLQKYEGDIVRKGLVLLAGCALAHVLSTDYAAFGVLVIAFFYIFQHTVFLWFWLMLLFAVHGGWEIYAAFALLICYFYDPQKEEVRLPRYAFYAFYPLHLLVLRGIWLLL